MHRNNTIAEHGNEMRSKIEKGVNVLYDAVCATMGPGGGLVVIEQPNGEPLLLKDGVTVSEHIHLEESVENLGVQVVRQSAQKTFKKVGDGTTTSICLAKHMLDRLKGIKVDRDLEMKVGLELEDFKNFLSNQTIQFHPENHLEHVLRTASNGDEDIVENLKEIYEFQGFDSTIYTKKNESGSVHVVKENFYMINSGMFSKEMANKGGTFVGDDVLVFVLDYKINSMQDFDPLLLEGIYREKKPVLFLCNGCDPQALRNLVNMNACVVQPSRSFSKLDSFNDLCALTGANLISEATGRKKKSLTAEDAGYLTGVYIADKHTKLFQENKMKGFSEYVEAVRSTIVDAESDHEVELIKDRVNKLNMKVANISIGGNSEAEMIEIDARYDDAIKAVKSSAKHGVVRGNAYTLSLFKSDFLMTNCCKEKVYLNAGIIDVDDPYLPYLFYDFDKDVFIEYQNLDVYDPVMALLESVKNASSVALSLAKTSVAIYYQNQNEIF